MRLLKLPNGAWVNPEHVTGIEVAYEKDDVNIFLIDGQIAALRDVGEDAQTYADAIAAQIVDASGDGEVVNYQTRGLGTAIDAVGEVGQ